MYHTHQFKDGEIDKQDGRILNNPSHIDYQDRQAANGTATPGQPQKPVPSYIETRDHKIYKYDPKTKTQGPLERPKK